MPKNNRGKVQQFGATSSELSKALNISEDRVNALANNPGSATVKRLCELCDYIGCDPMELIKVYLCSRRSYEGIGEISDCFVSTREQLFAVFEQFEDSNVTKALKDVVDLVFKYPLIYITGNFSAGKFSMAQNLAMCNFGSCGSDLRKSYSRFLVIASSRAGIKFNYPIGEYLYKIESDELITELLNNGASEQMYSGGLTPAIKDGMTSGNYVIFSDSKTLDTLNIICSNNINEEISETASAKESEIVSSADIIIIMLEENLSVAKIRDIIRIAWEHWNAEITQHLIFAVAKSDHIDLDAINGFKTEYAERITSLLKLMDIDIPQDTVFGMICSYSSIFSGKPDSGKADAGYNWDFSQKLRQMILQVTDDRNRRNRLSEILDSVHMSLLNKSEIEQSVKTAEIHRIVTKYENEFKKAFSESYDKIFNMENIIEVINKNNIEKSKSYRTNLAIIIETALMGCMYKVLPDTLKKMEKEVENSISLTVKDKMYKDKLASEISHFAENASNDVHIWVAHTAAVRMANLIPTVGLGMSLLPSPIPGSASIMAASNAISLYWAQTNFEKNTSKKIISTYEQYDVKEKITEAIISKYFKPMRKTLLESSGNAADEQKVLSLIDKLLDILKNDEK